MKSNTHPTYYSDVVITCACGNSIATGSTEQAIAIEVCSACHPFYTGKQKMVDVAGRVDKFRQRLEVAGTMKEKKASAVKAPKKTTSPKKDSNISLSK